MANSVSVNGRKKVSTLQKEFSDKFQFLFIAFIKPEDRNLEVNVRSLDNSKTLAELRTKFSNETLTLNGKTLVKNIEKYFWDNLGLACQIAVHNYKGKILYFPIGDFFNGLSLTKANEWAETQGCSKVVNIENFSKMNVF